MSWLRGALARAAIRTGAWISSSGSRLGMGERDRQRTCLALLQGFTIGHGSTVEGGVVIRVPGAKTLIHETPNSSIAEPG